MSTETAGSDAPAKKASVKNAAEVQCVIDGLGGKENILSVDNCFTRLRVNIKDPAKLDEAAINKLPNSGIVKRVPISRSFTVCRWPISNVPWRHSCKTSKPLFRVPADCAGLT